MLFMKNPAKIHKTRVFECQKWNKLINFDRSQILLGLWKGRYNFGSKSTCSLQYLIFETLGNISMSIAKGFPFFPVNCMYIAKGFPVIRKPLPL